MTQTTDLERRLRAVASREDCMGVPLPIMAELARLRAENEALREALSMAVAEMSRARGRLETIAMCNEDRRIAAALGGTCDFARTAMKGSSHE